MDVIFVFLSSAISNVDSGGWRWTLILLNPKPQSTYIYVLCAPNYLHLSRVLRFNDDIPTLVSFYFLFAHALALKHVSPGITDFRKKPRIFPLTV
jgi:hypothetical protein